MRVLLVIEVVLLVRPKVCSNFIHMTIDAFYYLVNSTVDPLKGVKTGEGKHSTIYNTVTGLFFIFSLFNKLTRESIL